MVVQTDKGLGPGAIEPREYVRYATRDHLGDTQTYQHLTPAAASIRAIKVQKMLEKWIQTYLDVISKEERKCGHSDKSATSAPLGHHLLWHTQRDSAREIWTQTPALLPLHQQRPRHLAGRSRPS